MRKLISKISILLLVLVAGLTLTACKNKNKYNTNAPTYNSTTEYASVGDLKLTEGELYNLMRANGYSFLVDMIVEELVPTTGLDINKKEDHDDLVDLINLDCYGTDELDDLTESQMDDYEEKYIDNMYLKGVDIREEGIYSDTNLKHYLPQLAQQRYARALLEDTNSIFYYKNENQKRNGEDVLDDNGDPIANPYYVTEEAIENKYNSNFNENNGYKAIIVGYHTLADAKENITFDPTNKNLTAEQLKSAFDSMYNAQYGSFKTNEYDYTDADLTAYNAGLVTLLQNMEAGEYKLNQQFGKMVYHVYLIETKPEADFDALTQDEKDELALEILDDYTTSSFVTVALNEKLSQADITIYDPAYDALFANDNAEHERLLAKEWDDSFSQSVAKVNDKTISTKALYEKLEASFGYSVAMDYFTKKILLTSTYASKLTKDDLNQIEEDFETVMESFNNDEFAAYGYASNIGEENFKLLYFGQTSDEEVINHYKSQKIWEYKIADRPESYYEKLVEFGKLYVEDYYNLSVKHVLLYVDYNADGTPDDPEAFMEKLASDEARDAFKAKMTELMNLFVDEVDYLVRADKANMKDALDYVKEQFYANGNLHSTTGSWKEHKAYGIGVTVEDLSTINNSNAANYVPEFGIGVQEFYNELVETQKITNNRLKDNQLQGQDIVTKDENGAEKIEKVDLEYSDLIQTTYGYHILGAYNTGSLTSAKYTAEDNDKTGQYATITVTLNGTEQVLNAYSSEKYASLNQIKIYAAEVGTEDGVTHLPTDVVTFIGYFYNTVETRYADTTFQNILFAQNELANMTFTNSANKDKFEEYLAIQVRQFDSYDIDEDWWNIFFPQNA